MSSIETRQAEAFERLSSTTTATTTKQQVNKQKMQASAVTTTTIPTSVVVNTKIIDHKQTTLKLKLNYSKEELGKVRRMIKLFMMSSDNSIRTEEEVDFWRQDCERLMQDDWLLSRFMYRGIKRSKNSQDTNNNNDEDYHDYNNKIHDEQDENNNNNNENELDRELRSLEPHILETLKLILDCAKFRFEYRINAHSALDEFPADWVAKNGIFSHGFDMQGNCVIYMRAKCHHPKSITKDVEVARHQFKRLLVYWLEQSDQMLINREGKGVCCVFDMSEVSRENMDLDIIQWISQSIKQSGPKLLAYVIIYNLPWFFATTFRLFAANLLYKTSKQTLKFVNGSELLNYIEPSQLPEYLKDKYAQPN